MNRPTRITVVGAGDAGRALAATLALRGLAVTLFSRSDAKLEPLRRHGLKLVRPGVGDDHVKLDRLTTDLKDAISCANVVLVATNSMAYVELAMAMASSLSPDQLVLLVPGHTGGALEFRHALTGSGGSTRTVIAEMALPFVCRSADLASMVVLQEKRSVRLACVPATATTDIVGQMRDLFPQLEPAANVLETGFENITSVIQPCLVLFNAARIDAGERFTVYRSGLSPAIAGTMESIDQERTTIAAAYGIRVQSAAAWFATNYDAKGDTLYDRLMTTAGYERIQSPSSLDHRFLIEHVPTGTVPIAALGSLAGVPAPLSNALVDLASSLVKIDLRKKGRTLDRLGLRGCTVEQVKRIALNGGSSP